MEKQSITALGGALKYDWQAELWRWADGIAESRVRTLDRQYFAPNFRCARQGGTTYVEIPRGWEKKGYHWDGSDDIREAIETLIVNHGIGGGVFAEGYVEMMDDHQATVDGWRVPVEKWDAVMREPCGAGWDKKHEADILAIAEKFTGE